MTDEAERGTSRDGKKERNSWLGRAKKPPVNLWMLIHSLALHPGPVNVLMLPRPGRVRGDAQRRKPQPQGQLSKHCTAGGDGYHTCTHILPYHKHTQHWWWRLRIRYRSKNLHAHSNTEKACSHLEVPPLYTSADTYHLHIYINTHLQM